MAKWEKWLRRSDADCSSTFHLMKCRRSPRGRSKVLRRNYGGLLATAIIDAIISLHFSRRQFGRYTFGRISIHYARRRYNKFNSCYRDRVSLPNTDNVSRFRRRLAKILPKLYLILLLMANARRWTTQLLMPLLFLLVSNLRFGCLTILSLRRFRRALLDDELNTFMINSDGQ